MPKLLCKIDDTFEIKSMGTVIMLEKQNDWRIAEDEKVKVKEVIRIIHSDKSSLKTHIKAIEFALVKGTDKICFILPKDVKTHHAPKGSQVFLEREDESPIMWDGRKTEFST